MAARRAPRKEAKEAEEIAAAYRTIFRDSPSGRVILDDLRKAFYRQPVTRSRRQTDFQCGAYEVVDRILFLAGLQEPEHGS